MGTSPAFLWSWDPGLLLSLDCNYTRSSLGSQALELELDVYHWLSWASGLPTAGLGTSGMRNHVSQFFMTNLFLSMHLRLIGSVSLETPA